MKCAYEDRGIPDEPQPCERAAMPDSDYCALHQNESDEAFDAQLESYRRWVDRNDDGTIEENR